MDTLLVLVASFNSYAKSNPVVAGLMGLFGMSIVTFLLVKLPSRIGAFLKRQFTTTLTFNNSMVGNGLENFAAFLQWFHAHHWSSWVRAYAIDGVYHGNSKLGTVIGVGPGNHLFLWRGRLFWLRRETLAQSSQYQINMQITVTLLGRNAKLLMELIDAFRYRPDESKIGIYTFDQDWKRVADINKRGLATVIVKTEIKTAIISALEFYRDNRPWYEERGIPYKKTFLLHGEPGTGKTSLIKGIASHFNMNLCLLNLTQMSDTSLERALVEAPANSIIAMEDFDSATATHGRIRVKKAKSRLEATADRDEEENSKDGTANFMSGFLTLGGILNAMDGLASLDGKIIFLSTNHLNLMDKALVRPGRVDHTYEIGPLEDREIRDYVHLMFPELTAEKLQFHGPWPPILGCDLQALYFIHHDNPYEFMRAIPRLTLVAQQQQNA